MDYRESLEYLMKYADYERLPRSGIVWDIKRIERLCQRLGDPQYAARTVHVAGTKGKGSTSAMIASILKQAGYRTGLYTSPHLLSFTERIRFDSRPIAEADWARLVEVLQPHVEAENAIGDLGELTTFEILTAMAFLHFRRMNVQWAVVEVGMGGRLDATNVIESSVAVITSIGADHTSVLGATPAQIAAEKAGIIRPEVPVVSGVAPGEAATVIERVAERCEAPLVRADERAVLRWLGDGPDGMRFTAEVEPWGRLELGCPLHGRHQLANASTALATLSVLIESGVEIEAEAVVDGFARARWPGRLEPCPGEPRLWWDGAHNPDGFHALAQAWAQDLAFAPPATLVLALAQDKDVDGIAAELLPWMKSSRLLATQSRNPRAMPAAELGRRLAAAGLEATVLPDVAAALDEALVAEAKGRALLCGSLFAVAEAMLGFGGAPGEWL